MIDDDDDDDDDDDVLGYKMFGDFLLSTMVKSPFKPPFGMIIF